MSGGWWAALDIAGGLLGLVLGCVLAGLPYRHLRGQPWWDGGRSGPQVWELRVWAAARRVRALDDAAERRGLPRRFTSRRQR